MIFILADDLGWMDVSVYGSDLYETPAIDSLAQTAVRFTNAYAASPLCSPTRASILTGQEVGRLRLIKPLVYGQMEPVLLNPRETDHAREIAKATVPQSRNRLPNTYVTFAEVLKEHGYATAFMGKWHLGADPYIPENQGFDYVVGGREDPGPPPPGHYFAPWSLDTLPNVQDGTHISDVLTDSAIQFVKNNQTRPFLLCLWYYDVHTPLQAKGALDVFKHTEMGTRKRGIVCCATRSAVASLQYSDKTGRTGFKAANSSVQRCWSGRNKKCAALVERWSPAS
ncbi:MAG: sulfatase-like hydrolase/transferase [Deltaproteobacteria bacterium]|nr:sulfatase-like hydrolase/transferase [Deltaproteobacteria bacterium]